MMIKTLLPLALALPAILSPLTVQAQSVPIFVGMEYGVARQRLINAGWKPLVSLVPAARWFKKLNGPERDYHLTAQTDLASYFRSRGWFETLDCAPTGRGLCGQQFFNANGKGLVVATTNGQGSKPPVVEGYSFIDGTR